MLKRQIFKNRLKIELFQDDQHGNIKPYEERDDSYKNYCPREIKKIAMPPEVRNYIYFLHTILDYILHHESGRIDDWDYNQLIADYNIKRSKENEN